MNSKTILVLGATGKTGRRVAQRLRSRELPIRLGSRAGDPPFDWEDRDTWLPALRGVTSVYISYYPDLMAPGAADAIHAFTEAAAGAGVRHLVLLSARGEPDAQRCERIVQASGLAWTLLRVSWFAQNFSENFFLEPILEGTVALPVGEVGEPFIDADDIADVAVAALTEEGHHGQLYELTGPRLWTFREAVNEIARVTGRDIDYVQIPHADYLAALEQAAVPQELVRIVDSLFTEVLDGRNAVLADGVRRALGRAPRDFAAYVRDTAVTGVWNPQN